MSLCQEGGRGRDKDISTNLGIYSLNVATTIQEKRPGAFLSPKGIVLYVYGPPLFCKCSFRLIFLSYLNLIVTRASICKRVCLIPDDLLQNFITKWSRKGSCTQASLSPRKLMHTRIQPIFYICHDRTLLPERVTKHQ